MSEQDIFKEIQEVIDNNNIVLFMKGTKLMPMCGFSSVIVAILKKLNVEFLDINVLENEKIREGVKKFTNWPTIPQLYVNGEFVGGCDIVKELYSNGELEEIIKDI
jgi:monothiol glutaredoxin